MEGVVETLAGAADGVEVHDESAEALDSRGVCGRGRRAYICRGRPARRHRQPCSGHRRAKLNPADPDVPEIGDEIAVARALIDLGHRLLNTAAGDIVSVTHEHVTLSH